jgi:hypothetical protein
MGKFAEMSLLIEQGNEKDLIAFLAGRGIKNPSDEARKMIKEYDDEINDAMQYEYSKQYETDIIEGRVDDGSWEGR